MGISMLDIEKDWGGYELMLGGRLDKIITVSY